MSKSLCQSLVNIIRKQIEFDQKKELEIVKETHNVATCYSHIAYLDCLDDFKMERHEMTALRGTQRRSLIKS